MGRSRHVVLTQAAGAATEEGPPSLGSLEEVTAALARYNTAPDGSSAREGGGLTTTLMHGPGMVLEMAEIEGEVRQVMVTMTDDDFCFPVLMRLCRERRWTMLDPETGRKFGP